MIKKLEWDSSFFGYSVGQAIVKAGEITNEQNLLNEAENYKLVYVVSGEEIILPFARLKFVDTKTTLIKEGLVKENCFDFNLIEDFKEQNEKLENLALQSGVYSRFRIDSNFVNKEFEKLYHKWLADSLNKILADNVIVFNEQGECNGFITVKCQNDFALIGLIAVDEKSKGKGVGLALLNYVNNLAIKNGLDKIKVVTQLGNIAAMKLYEKAGYTIESKKYIYHLWN